MSPAKFRTLIWRQYRAHGRRDLPWRHTRDLYRILVSEVMLQQTQVGRVLPFYARFVKKFPTAKRLAQAPLSEVLKSWQGLGYNRRAKLLHRAAKEILRRKSFTVAELEALPGVGPYTARAISAFAYNTDVIFIETNIRTAIIHHFFPNRKEVSDKLITEVLIRTFPKGRAREWYSALMDYGAHLKRSGTSHNTQSRQYTKQSRFSGSLREARGAILRELTRGTVSFEYLGNLFSAQRQTQVYAALEALIKEGIVEKRGAQYYALAD